MKKIYVTLLAVIAACSFSFARTFDGTEKIYLKANAVSWWTNDNCAQRAVLNSSETTVIGEIEDAGHAIYSFTIPAGDYSVIRFERAETAEQPAWNATGDIAIPAEGNYVTAFEQNSAEATWETYTPAPPVVYTTHHLTVTNNTGWDAFYTYAWGSSEAFGGWPGSDQLSLDFQAADGEVELHLIFHNNVGQGKPGDERRDFDITEARDYKLVVTAQGVTEGDPEPQHINDAVIKVRKLDSWNSMSIWAWNSADATFMAQFEAWPGVAMEDLGDGWYGFTVKVDADLIVNNGEGTEQSQAFSVSEDACFEIGTATNGEGHYAINIADCPENSAIEAVVAGDRKNTRKFIKDGRLFIIRDGKTFNVLGAEL